MARSVFLARIAVCATDLAAHFFTHALLHFFTHSLAPELASET